MLCPRMKYGTSGYSARTRFVSAQTSATAASQPPWK